VTSLFRQQFSRGAAGNCWSPGLAPPLGSYCQWAILYRRSKVFCYRAEKENANLVVSKLWGLCPTVSVQMSMYALPISHSKLPYMALFFPIENLQTSHPGPETWRKKEALSASLI
jgi:hypothetical protein